MELRWWKRVEVRFESSWGVGGVRLVVVVAAIMVSTGSASVSSSRLAAVVVGKSDR